MHSKFSSPHKEHIGSDSGTFFNTVCSTLFTAVPANGLSVCVSNDNLVGPQSTAEKPTKL